MKACLGCTVQIQKSQRNCFRQMTNGNFDNYNVDNDDWMKWISDSDWIYGTKHEKSMEHVLLKLNFFQNIENEVTGNWGSYKWFQMKNLKKKVHFASVAISILCHLGFFARPKWICKCLRHHFSFMTYTLKLKVRW